MSVKEELEREKRMLKGKSLKDKIFWFVEYYKLPVIITVVIVAIFVAMLQAFLTRKEQKAGIILVNAESQMIYEDNADNFENPIAESIGLDTKKYSVLVDATEHMTPGSGSDSFKTSAAQKIMVELAAGNMDVLCMDAWNFCSYAANGNFKDLREVLTDEQLEKYKDYLFYIDQDLVDARKDVQVSSAEEYPSSGTIADILDEDEATAAEQVSNFEMPDPSTMSNPVPVGIVFTDSPYFKETGLYGNTVPIVGVPATDVSTEDASRIIDLLWSR